MESKILIADDESDIVSMLGSFFESKGFRVLPAFNGAEALKQVEKQPDIILLDINMPGTDGLEVCKRIRDHISCPILFLTARIEDTDKVKGFTVGGDDYIVKPFSLVELEARVRAHLRREARHNFEAQVKFSGDLTIDYSERCLFFGDKRIGLAKKEFDIVELLSQSPGQVFDKERIYERIWGYDSEGDSSVVAEHMAIFLFPVLLPITEANPLFRLIGLLPLYHVQAVSLLSVEQMSNGMLYAVWAIPTALLFLGIGAVISRRVFAKHQVS